MNERIMDEIERVVQSNTDDEFNEQQSFTIKHILIDFYEMVFNDVEVYVTSRLGELK